MGASHEDECHGKKGERNGLNDAKEDMVDFSAVTTEMVPRTQSKVDKLNGEAMTLARRRTGWSLLLGHG